MSLLLNQNKSGISQEKANMDKKRAVIYAEPGKNIQNQATSIIHCNAIPQVDVVDAALANGIVVVPFRAFFGVKEQLDKFPEGTHYIHPVNTYYKSPEFLMKK